MNGPRIVCAGCGEPTSLYKPVCDDCRALHDEVAAGFGVERYCVLCEQGLSVEHGMHKTKTGGHAGRCTASSIGANDAT